MLIEMDQDGPQEDWIIVKPTDGKPAEQKPWFAQDKNSPRKVIVGEPGGRIYHRRQHKVSMGNGVGPKSKSVLIAELDGVAVYIKGDEIVIARAPHTVVENGEEVYKTNVII